MGQSPDDTTAARTADLTERDRRRSLASERPRVALEITDLEAPVGLDDLAGRVADRDAGGGEPDGPAEGTA